MLELKDIRKTYHAGGIETKALDGVSVAFRDREFVAILGTSGSGKTTCLNVIGGLDHYDSGDLLLKGKSTKSFKEKDWDAYRNNSVGFVFQSYNLISHLSIISNVEMGMTLSGVSGEEKKRRAIEVLEKVGLKDHIHKKPNQLSGGQMQRVAIARALANDPEILLCDEPTGALDSATSVQIMDLIKEVAKDRLVIMVTHNPELAEQYADRIIRFADGHIIDDSNPYEEVSSDQKFALKKTSMSFLTALNLSANNLRTKKGRTFLTAFASSIGIIGIAVILSLSTGFQKQVDDFQSDALGEFPVMMTKVSQSVSQEKLSDMSQEYQERMTGKSDYSTDEYLNVVDSDSDITTHINNFSDDFLDYIHQISPDVCTSIGYTRLVNMNLVRKNGDDYQSVTIGSVANQSHSAQSTSTSSMGISVYPESLAEGDNYLQDNYDLLAGEYPADENGVVLVVNTKNEIEKSVLDNLGFSVSKGDDVDFDTIVGTEFKVISNDDYYVQTPFNTYLPSTDYESMYNADNSFTIKISGIVRAKEGAKMSMLASGIAYSDNLSEKIINLAADSKIVEAQKNADYNVMSMDPLDDTAKNNMIAYLGGDSVPYIVMMFPKNFDAKDQILDYLDEYNAGKSTDDVIVYTDLAGTVSSMTSGIMSGITLVLIAFAGISLVVSMIMICIITYTSVLERRKEIGVLKALGARKKDITRVFDAETFILGILSGVLGIVIAWLCTFPINAAIYKAAELENVAHLQLSHAVTLIVISTVLTVLGGHIPARMASRKDAVEALRSE